MDDSGEPRQPDPGPLPGPAEDPNDRQAPLDAPLTEDPPAGFKDLGERQCQPPPPGSPPGFESLDAYEAWVEQLVVGDPGPAERRSEFRGWLEDEDAESRDAVPPEPDSLGLGITVSLGDAAGIDPALLAAMCGPHGLGGEGLGPQFRQDAPADALRPSPVLAALAEQASAGLAGLTDDELVGVLHASVRLENREAWRQQRLIGEFARRRQAAKDAETAANGGRLSCRAGEFPGEELAIELALSPLAAAARIADAQDLAGRLPVTLAGMAAGLIDSYRASIIAGRTHVMSAADAAAADEILASFAPGRRAAALAAKAAALELKLAPEAVAARKEAARRDFSRVEARREDSGNASLSGREMGTAAVIASKAHIDALAAKLRAAGVPGTLDALRVLVFTELTQGRDPLDLITTSPGPASPASADPEDRTPPAAGPDSSSDAPGGDAPGGDPAPAGGGAGHPGDDSPGLPPRWGPGDPGYDEDPGDDTLGSVPRRDPAPYPALVNLLIPAGTWLGWSTAPGQAAGWGLLDPRETRDLLRAAAGHPRTRWCATLTGPDGTAVAHACAAGQHPWLADIPPPPPAPDSNSNSSSSSSGSGGGGPDPPQAAQLTAIITRLGLTFRPIARGRCDHAAAEDRYTPSRSLRHLIRARTDRCDAPGCGAQALHADLDHTIEYPAGISCECNLGPKCRRHHRCKQAWKLEQTEPGILRWTLPSGRIHTTTPTVYDL